MTGDEAPDLADVPTDLIVARARRIKERRAKVMADAGQLAIALNTRGYSFVRIGEIMGAPPQTVHRWAKRYREGNTPGASSD